MTLDKHDHYWVPFQPMFPRFDAEAATGPVPEHTLVKVCKICGHQEAW